MKDSVKTSFLSPVWKTIAKRLFRHAFRGVLPLIALNSSLGFAAVCDYAVVDDWATGFRAEITVNNNTDEPLNGWELSWEWADGSVLQNGWDASFDCSSNACRVSAAPWMPVIAANQTIVFGLVANKGQTGVASAPVSLQGEICTNGGGTDPVTQADVLWTLRGDDSRIHYVSTKKDHVAEVNTFLAGVDEPAALVGTIDRAGRAVVAIDLNDVATGIDIRDERMANFVFETEFLPTAYIAMAVDTAALDAMAVGTSEVQSITGSLSLHGVRQQITADVLVVKRSATAMSVSSLTPIIIDSRNFDMASGIEMLKTIANLTSIGQSVPVYFQLFYQANTNPDQLPVAMSSSPGAPDQLEGNYDALSSEATLSWQDNSVDESHFILRRKATDGFWQTVATLLSNTTSFSEGLPETGEFEYKVIAVNNSVPSAPSNIVHVVVTEADPVAVGQQIFGEQCAGCHGADGSGVGSFPAINTARDVNAMIEIITNSMPLGNPSACDRSCAEDVAAFIQTLWVVEAACDRDLSPVSYGARQLKILTRSEYQNSVEDLLGVDFDAADGLSADEKVGFFFNNTHAAIVASSYSNYLIVAERIAQWSAERNFAPAVNCSIFSQDCADAFIDSFMPKVFRRPLNSAELATYSEMANGSLTGGNVKDGIEMAMETALSSPQFLYRHELGESNPDNNQIASDAFELSSYEMATFLAYTFTGSTPDERLLAAAANDELRTSSNIMQQAVRLANSAEAKSVMGDFVGSWLGTANLESAAKDENVWPGFLALVPHMKREIRETFANVMLDAEESFASLYTANYSYLNQTLAQHYGIAGVSGNELRKVATPDRGGVLANGAFMARWGEAVETSPILRSVRVRRRMLCQDQPDPPAGTFEAREQKLAELSELLQDPTTTNRVKYHRLTEDQPCTNCHLQYINPLGFGMEDFDTVGRVRTADLNGNVIDAVGELFAPNDYNNVSEVEPFAGTQDLGQVLASLPSAQSCLSKQMFRYVMGVGHQDIDPDNPDGPELTEPERSGYACEIDTLTESMMSESPRSMLEQFGTLEAVRYRKAWSRD